MASKLIELADGTLVEIEVSENKAQPIAGGAAEKLQDATIDKVKPILLKACKPIVEVWKELNKDMHIEQAAVELGLGFEAEGNFYITKAKGNANLEKRALSLQGKLDNPVVLEASGGPPVTGWKLCIEDETPLKGGYSGSPVICTATGTVVAVATSHGVSIP